jgi:hypothetical protein
MALVGLEVPRVLLGVAKLQKLVFHGRGRRGFFNSMDSSSSAIAFCFARAIGATQEAHFISYCRLLPPRKIAKSF